MTPDEYIAQLEELTADIQTNEPNNMWQFAIERLAEGLRLQLAGTNLARNIQYQIEGSLVSLIAPDYLLYQNYGIAGAEGNPKGAGPDEFRNGHIHSFGINRIPPSASHFTRYDNDPNDKYRVKWSVFKWGVRPKGWFTRAELVQDYLNYVRTFINDNI